MDYVDYEQNNKKNVLNDSFKDLFKNIKEVITMINNFRDFQIEAGFQLPRLVVMGIQSSGKSSLLEQIAQLDFLPRGANLVTRCPLEIRLIQDQSLNRDFVPYAYFFDNKSKIYKNFEEVKKRIEQITEEKAGSGKKIIDDLIVLTIVQNKCPTLTLIDLPGITQISIEDQEQDIENLTTEMTLKYINDNQTIIMCVVPINDDFTNSVALKVASKADPQRNRTVCVLTKIDIMNPGTDCKSILNNGQFQFKKGIFGMKLRNQDQINNHMSVEEAIEEEEIFFKKSKIYQDQVEFTGTKALTQKLSQLLDSHIRENLPTIYENIKIALKNKKVQLQSLGKPFSNDRIQANKSLSVLINNTVSLFNKFIIKQEDNIEIKDIVKLTVDNRSGKHHLNYLLDSFEQTCLQTLLQIYQSYSLNQVGEDLLKHRVPVNGFIPIEAFQQKIIQCMNIFEEKSLDLVVTIKNYLKKSLTQLIDEQPYPNTRLTSLIKKIGQDALQKEFKTTKQHIQTNFKCFKECIYSRSNEYQIKPNCKVVTVYNQSQNQTKLVYDLLIKSKMFFNWNLSQLVDKVTTYGPSNRAPNDEFLETTPLKDLNQRRQIFRYCFLFRGYLENFKNQIIDQIPQFIQTLLINKFSRDIYVTIINELLIPEKIPNLNSLLQEDESKAFLREATQKSLNSLKKAFICLLEQMKTNTDYSKNKQSENEENENEENKNEENEISEEFSSESEDEGSYNLL